MSSDQRAQPDMGDQGRRCHHFALFVSQRSQIRFVASLQRRTEKSHDTKCPRNHRHPSLHDRCMDLPRREHRRPHRFCRIEPGRSGRLELGETADTDAAGGNRNSCRTSNDRREIERCHRHKAGERNRNGRPATGADARRSQPRSGAATERTALVCDLSGCLPRKLCISKHEPG